MGDSHMVNEQTRKIGGSPITPPYVPSVEEVEALIATVEAHPLGLRFLLEGHLGSVATTFRTHAFTVDAARERLRERLRRQGKATAGG
jgi:hypothetical protein